MKIRTRLLAMLVVLLGLGLYLLAHWIVGDLQPRYLGTMEESMVNTAAVLAALASDPRGDGGLNADALRTAFAPARERAVAARIYAVSKTNVNLRVYLTDARGRVVFDSDGGRDEGRDYSRWNDVARTLRGQYGARTTLANPRDPRTATLYVAAPVKVRDRVVGVLTVCKPADSVRAFIDVARRQTIAVACLAGLAVMVLGTVVTFWITRPVQKLTAYAEAVRDGQFAKPPALGRGDIAMLGRAFEQMRDALEGKQYVEHYVQTLTHEMKSPLAAIRGAAELLHEEMPAERRERFLDNIRAEAGRMQDLVDRLLELAAVESRKALRDVENVRLADVVREVLQSLAPTLTARKTAVACELDEALTVRGERFLIRQSLTNLLQNAADFSPAGGGICLSARRRGDEAEIAVRDHGPGVPAYALSRLFERFYSLPRSEKGRKGTGLGLTFAHEAMALHRGRVTIENCPDGGVLAALHLPV